MDKMSAFRLNRIELEGTDIKIIDSCQTLFLKTVDHGWTDDKALAKAHYFFEMC